MFGEEKNLKDTPKDSIKDTLSVPVPYQASSFGLGSYTKTNKLITALYMVTDIIDKDEPLRNKLRTLGTGIISDTYLIKQDHTGHTTSLMSNKVQEIMSFLDIAAAMNIISEMNCNILRKEFFELNESILSAQAGKESMDTNKIKVLNGQVDLVEFFANPPLLDKEGAGGGNSLITTSPFRPSSSTRRRGDAKGHTSIGVQKGSTLLKALGKIQMSNNLQGNTLLVRDFDILKKQRRAEITNFITKKGGNVTITDIKNGVQGSLISSSEKTLQRELVSMVKDGVLNKTGEKRWSRYFLK